MSDKRIRWHGRECIECWADEIATDEGESELAKAIRRDGDFAYHIGRAIYAASRMRVP